MISCQTTYKELKQKHLPDEYDEERRCQTTYKELKHIRNIDRKNDLLKLLDYL